MTEADWTVARSDYDPDEDSYYESLFGLSNGRLGVRATVDFDAGGGRPGCLHFDVYGPGITVPRHIVNILNPTFRALSVGGMPLSVAAPHLVSFRQELDFRRASHRLSAILRGPDGMHTRLSLEIVLAAPHADVALSILEIESIDHDRDITLQVGLDWSPGNGDFGGVHDRVRLHHLEVLETHAVPGRLEVLAGTAGGRTRIGVAASVRAQPEARATVRGRGRFAEMLRFQGSPGRVVRVEQLAVAAAGDDPLPAASARLDTLLGQGHDAVLAEHLAAWEARWALAAEAEGSAELVAGLRYAQFQLLQSLDRGRDVTNIAARGLTSEYHSGHFFFNTELFVLPYCAWSEPEVARAMLRFRVRTLAAARQHAEDTGFRGARFPEEADREGRPVSPFRIVDPFTGATSTEWSGQQVVHLSADVLHALATYLGATGDEAFLRSECMPLVTGCARYLADLMRPDEAVGGRGARRVMGFDEYHYDVNHHFATNLLAKWALRWSADTVERLCGQGSEAAAWRNVAEEIYLPPPEDGVHPVFHGYFTLPDKLRRTTDDHRLPLLDPEDRSLADRLETFPTRLTKQADVVHVMTLLPDLFDEPTIARNLRYYEPRCAHESSLSMSPHAIAAAWTGDLDLAVELMLASARYNLDFVPRVHYENGAHIAAYAGAWLVLLRGFLGVRTAGEELHVSPRLPRAIGRLRVPFVWRSARLVATLDQVGLTLRSEAGNRGDVIVAGGGARSLLRPGEEWHLRAEGVPS